MTWLCLTSEEIKVLQDLLLESIDAWEAYQLIIGTTPTVVEGIKRDNDLLEKITLFHEKGAYIVE